MARTHAPRRRGGARCPQRRDRQDLKDPRVGFVTVTGVKTSPDLRHARVYVSVLGDQHARTASLDGLRSAHGFLQRPGCR